ncbi:MAG TPA: ABC transporter permease, partial [Bryobacteraceae bacterium]|nr:ABC transporter permease [Bryobacteraceae bacterium]
IASRLRAVFSKQRLDRDFEDELRDHLESLAEEFRAAGMTPAEARRAALLKLGHPEQLRESNRDHRGMPKLEGLAQDLRFAIRTLWKSRGFTSTAVLSLALGIGINAALFSLIDALLLRPLPVKAPDRLVNVQRLATVKGGFGKPIMPMAAFESVKGLHTIFSDVAGFNEMYRPVISIEGVAEPGRGAEQGTSSFFRVLGVEAEIGRTENDAPGVVISDRFWKTRFGGNANALGRTLSLNGRPYPILGVAPPRFHGLSLDTSADVWLLAPFVGPYAPSLIGRLNPGIDLAQAQAAAEVLFRQMDQQPGMFRKLGPGMVWRTEVTPAGRGRSSLREAYQKPLLALLVLVALVLLITCTNIGNLLVVRNTSRMRELTMRAALGARRSRIVMQLLVESITLAAAGGALALWVARWGASAIVSMLPLSQIPEQLEFRVDAQMLLFLAAVSTVSALLFALAPAWRASRVDLTAGLKAAPQTWTSRETRRLGRWLVAGQVALCVVLLAGAGLFLRTLRNVARTDPGFDTHNLLQVEIDTSGYRAGQINPLFKLLLDRVAAIPGVENVSGMRNPIMGGMSIALVPFANTQITIETADIGPRFFETMRVPLRRGRFFTPEDVAHTDPVPVVVSESYANEFFPYEDAIGKRLPRQVTDSAGAEIIGVVGDTKFAGLRAEAVPMAYTLALREEQNRMSALEVRTSGDPTNVIRAIQEEVRRVNPRLLLSVKTMQDAIGESMAQERMVAATSGFFGVLGLALAGIGLFGAASFTVAQRTSELGIRMALGASRWNVIRESLRDTALVFGLGLIAGGAAAFAAARLAGSMISGLLFGLTAADWTNIAAAGVIMFAVAVVACTLPALRAARIDPLESIRYE